MFYSSYLFTINKSFTNTNLTRFPFYILSSGKLLSVVAGGDRRELLSAINRKHLFPRLPFLVHEFTHSLPCVTTQNHKIFSHGVGRSRPGKCHNKFVLAAHLSNPHSLNLGFDSQTWESQDVSELRWIGPIPGDIAEVEAYCRIFRAVENLHRALMDTLYDPVSGERMVLFDSSSLHKLSFEDKIVSVLGCMITILNREREDVLGGRLKCKLNALDDKLPPLAIFRGEIKRCCEIFHVALDDNLSPNDDRSCNVWTKLQRLKNICYDLGFPREDDSPQHGLLANWAPVYFSTSKEAIRSEDSEIAFLKGGQVTEEGLKWLMDNGFKTIVDLRDEVVKDSFYDMALKHAIDCGKVELIKLPVETGMAPSKEQVEKFASVVSDSNRRPVYVHSREGVWRTSAMISRWRQYIAQSEVQADPHGVSHDQVSMFVKTFDETNNETEFSSEVVDEIQSGQRVHISPFKAQLPPKNAFSRKTMSRFFKRRKTSPSLFNRQLSLQPVPVSTEGQQSTSQIVGEEGLEIVGGNMCASSTGFVRVQSRKKAEMFLVRTDGVSCHREKVNESSLEFTHPSTQQQMLLWKSRPKSVLLLKKLGQELIEEAKEVALFLHHEEQMNIFVEPEVHDIFARTPELGFVQTFIGEDTRNLHEKVDFVACLGGDGVILHASNLFKGPVPPVVSFNLGSLGFLTSHEFEEYQKDLRQVIQGKNSMEGVYVTLRMRLRCEIHRNGKALPGKVYNIMNEVVVDRGSNPYLSKIECYENDRLITKVQGDGVIIATPTGSTAYSTSAGGSMVHPNVPCILFTPICPHSLSFRPVILPDSASFELKIPEDARSNAWVSFDGKKRKQLCRGDSIRIFMSEYPLPTVNKSDQTGDWFHSLVRCLNWNERLEQKAL